VSQNRLYAVALQGLAKATILTRFAESSWFHPTRPLDFAV